MYSKGLTLSVEVSAVRGKFISSVIGKQSMLFTLL